MQVSMGGETCAIPARRVLKVLRRVKLYSFPAREPSFVGLTRFGTEPVAVLDGAVVFGLDRGGTEHAPESVVVMVSGGQDEEPEVFGLLVDGADRVFTRVGDDSPAGDIRVCDPGAVQHSGG